MALLYLSNEDLEYVKKNGGIEEVIKNCHKWCLLENKDDK